MKKIVLFGLLIGMIWSCSKESVAGEDFHFEILPIRSVDIPETLMPNDVNRIIYRYNVPSTCHSYNDLYYIENGNQRTIAVVNLVTNSSGIDQPCQTLVEFEEERGFDFFVAPGFTSYVFNFWQGEDENGEDVYLTVEVPVGTQ